MDGMWVRTAGGVLLTGKMKYLERIFVPLPLYPSRQRKKNIPVCVCVCVCVCVYIYIYIYICVCGFFYVCTYVFIYMCICVCMYMCSCVCVCICIFFEHFYLWVRNPLSAVVDIQNMTLQDASYNFITWYTLAWNVGSFFEVRTWIWSARQNISI